MNQLYDMTGEELRSLRGSMSGQALGALIAKRMGMTRPYTAQEVWTWESGTRPVPPKVAIVVRSWWRQQQMIFSDEDGVFIMRRCPRCGAEQTAPPPLRGAEIAVHYKCGSGAEYSKGRVRERQKCEAEVLNNDDRL